MTLPFKFSLPFHEPVLIFSLVLFIILFAHLVLKRIKVPSIIGIIVAGIAVGPNGFNLLERDASIILFGTVGILYLMFLAGLEIDLRDFKKNRNKGIIFGLLTFSIPMILGIFSTYYILGFNILTSILLASMYASHTLLAYPIASRFGISKTESVSITVSGTIITDVAALLVLAIIAAIVKGELNQGFWIQLLISFTLFIIFTAFLVPRIGHWFFKRIESDGGSQFVFILAIVFSCAFLATLSGIEGIIGAFFAGLALNKLIPRTSPLMNRLEFVGNTLFIPFFLLNVGMLVDLKTIFLGNESLFVGAVMSIVAISGKWLAAFISQKIFKYSKDDRNIIFGLSNAQAAATLAAVLVGFKLGIFNEQVLNGTIIMILITCFVSSFVVEKAGKKIAIRESDKMADPNTGIERILVPVSNVASIEYLLDLALMIKSPKSKEPIYPLTVIKDDHEAQDKLIKSRAALEKAVKHASASDHPIQIISRIDSNISEGVARTIIELQISKILIGWNGKPSTHDRIFGTVMDNLLNKSDQMIMVCRIIHPVHTAKRIIIMVPQNAEFEVGFVRWIKSVRLLSRQTGSNILFLSQKNTLEKLKFANKSLKPYFEASFKTIENLFDIELIARFTHKDDLLIFISARKGTLSYNSRLDQTPRQVAKTFEENNFIILYPEQNTSFDISSTLDLGELPSAPIPENIERINKIGKAVRDVIRKRRRRKRD